MSSAFADVEDQQEAQAVELSDNVARDFLTFFRGNVVGHEQNGLLMYYSMLTGWAYDDGCHNNVLGIGAPGSGKSLTKNTVEKLFDGRDTYTKTAASGNAILDSVDWDTSLIAIMDEYDKVDGPIIEVLKSSNPEDGGFSKDRNVEDKDAPGGYAPVEISAEANPWVVLYAPTSRKGGVDDELEDRALILYFSNSKHTRRGILRKEFGHDSITTPASDDEYIYDTQAIAAALRQHTRSLPTRTEQEEDDDGNVYTASRSGAVHHYIPPWVVYACEPIFNIDEDYSNRVFGLVVNAIVGSAIDNRQNRKRKEVEIYVDEDTTNTETRQAVVVEPQDVANVLSCLEALLSTTHQLTPLKRHILEAVDRTASQVEGDGSTFTQIRDWLNDNDIPHPSDSTLRDRISDLVENYHLRDYENAGGKNGTATVYERHDEGALQAPNIRNLQAKADKDGIELAADDCVDIDPADPFDGCEDPIRDQPFKETVQAFEVQFSQGVTASPDDDSEAISMDEAMGGSSTESDSEGAQSSLTGVTEDGMDDTETVEDSTVEPDGAPDDPTEQWVFEALREHCTQPHPDSHGVLQKTGVVGYAEKPNNVDLSGTVADPSHEMWQDRPDHRDDRVVDEADARRELDEAYERLREKSCIVEDPSGGPSAMHTVVVAQEADI